MENKTISTPVSGTQNTITSYVQFSNWFIGKLIDKYKNTKLSYLTKDKLFGEFITSTELQTEFEKWNDETGLFKYTENGQLKDLNLKVVDLLVPAFTYYKCLAFDPKGILILNIDKLDPKNSLANNLSTPLTSFQKDQINLFFKQIDLSKSNLSLINKSDDIASTYEKLWNFLRENTKQYNTKCPSQEEKDIFKESTRPRKIFLAFDKILNPSKYKDILQSNYFEEKDFAANLNQIPERLIYNNKKYNTVQSFNQWSHILYSLSLVNGIDEKCTSFNYENISTDKNKLIKPKTYKNVNDIWSKDIRQKIIRECVNPKNIRPTFNRYQNYQVIDNHLINSFHNIPELSTVPTSLMFEYLVQAEILDQFNVLLSTQVQASNKNQKYYWIPEYERKINTSGWIQIDENFYIRNNQEVSNSGLPFDKAGAYQYDSAILYKDQQTNEVWQFNFESCAATDPQYIIEAEKNCLYHFYSDNQKHTHGEYTIGIYNPQTGNIRSALPNTVYEAKKAKQGNKVIDTFKRQADLPFADATCIKHNVIIQVVPHHDLNRQEQLFANNVIKPNWNQPNKNIYYKAVNLQDISKLISSIKNRDFSMFNSIPTQVHEQYHHFKKAMDCSDQQELQYIQNSMDHYQLEYFRRIYNQEKSLSSSLSQKAPNSR